MRAALVVVVLLTACVQPGDVVCNDGRICPAGYTCSSKGCLAPSQLEACDGVVEGGECANGTGRCTDGACIVAVCGDGIVEAPEVCDDGNQFSQDGCNGTCSSDETCGNGLVELAEQCDCGAMVASDQASCAGTMNGGGRCTTACELSRCGDGQLDPGEVCDDANVDGGDGCSFNCLSKEVCGNDILDYFAGEQCDDGNTRSVDGCSSTCKVEAMAWSKVSTDAPPPLTNAAIAYDTGRNVLVAFGGNASNTLQGTTWELRRTTWTQVALVPHPSPREAPAMAYDAKRRKIVLFGGLTANAVMSETWEYDGSSWKLLAPATVPPGRFSQKLAYDSARDRVVMFGGQTTYGGTRVNDTWEWDGVNWTQVTPTTTPPPVRANYGLTYDPLRNRVVLFGGIGASNVLLGDTWEYDGTTWTERTIAGPSARSGASLTFDVGRGQVVMAGGTETWTLDASGWTQLSTADPNRRFHAAAYDTERQAVVIFGGLLSTNALTNLVSLLGATTWSTPSSSEPGPSTGHRLVYDTRRGVVVMHKSGAAETWELTGTSWALAPTVSSPTPNRTSFGLAYDAARGKVVLFGGGSTVNGARLADTWEYDGTTWTQMSPAASPPARVGQSMAYDPVRQRVIMYGGFTGVAQSDLWEYDGSTWMEISVTTKPPAQQLAVMAYDTAKRRVVVVTGTPPETWVFENAAWRKLSSTGPRAINSGAMVYDAGRDRIVHHGGLNIDYLDETWELVDDTWELFLPTVFEDLGPGIFQHEMVYDPGLHRTILYGGSSASVPYTRFYAPKPQAAVEACTANADLDGDTLRGCADDDCWGYCTPTCVPDAPAASCSMVPRCGDGVCTAVENCRFCPADCPVGTGTCTNACGDGYCDPGESTTSCPGDCL